MKKRVFELIVAVCLSGVASFANACGTSGAKVTEIFQWMTDISL